MQVLDHEDRRCLRGLGGQERRPRRERLLAVGGGPRRRPVRATARVGRAADRRPRRGARARGDAFELGRRLLPVVGSLHAGRLTHDLLQRCERDRLAVGEAASPVPRRVLLPGADVIAQVGDEARLPDARVPDDRDELQRTLPLRPGEELLQEAPFRLTSDERRRVLVGATRRIFTQGVHDPHPQRLRLALHGDRLELVVPRRRHAWPGTSTRRPRRRRAARPTAGVRRC